MFSYDGTKLYLPLTALMEATDLQMCLLPTGSNKKDIWAIEKPREITSLSISRLTTVERAFSTIVSSTLATHPAVLGSEVVQI